MTMKIKTQAPKVIYKQTSNNFHVFVLISAYFCYSACTGSSPIETKNLYFNLKEFWVIINKGDVNIFNTQLSFFLKISFR